MASRNCSLGTPSIAGLGGGRMCSSALSTATVELHRYQTFMDIDIFMAICRAFLQRDIKLRHIGI